MKSKIRIIETGRNCGIFSEHPKFYPGKNEKEIQESLKIVRNKIAKKYKLKGRKIIQQVQKLSSNDIEYEDGKYIEVTKNMLKGDYWNLKLEADILVIRKNIRKVIIGHRMADCPIIIVEDRKKGICAITHCGAEQIDRLLPKKIIEILLEEYNSNVQDLYVYIGSYAHKENYIYDKYPKWAKNNDIWNTSIIRSNDNYKIDMKNAIMIQMKSLNVKHIKFSRNDTIKNERYYSHNAEYKGIIRKKGQNFVGFFYK